MEKTRILIVDDDRDIQKFVRLNLEARGYSVSSAGNGKEALQMIEETTPDLILLDIIMPEMDGFEVCRKIRERSKVPIIMLSAREGEGDREKCQACGADEYLTKPFRLKELFDTIKKLSGVKTD